VQRRKAFVKVMFQDSKKDKKLNHSPHSAPYLENLLFSILTLLNIKVKSFKENKESSKTVHPKSPFSFTWCTVFLFPPFDRYLGIELTWGTRSFTLTQLSAFKSSCSFQHGAVNCLPSSFWWVN